LSDSVLGEVTIASDGVRGCAEVDISREG